MDKLTMSVLKQIQSNSDLITSAISTAKLTPNIMIDVDRIASAAWSSTPKFYDLDWISTMLNQMSVNTNYIMHNAWRHNISFMQDGSLLNYLNNIPTVTNIIEHQREFLDSFRASSLTSFGESFSSNLNQISANIRNIFPDGTSIVSRILSEDSTLSRIFKGEYSDEFLERLSLKEHAEEEIINSFPSDIYLDDSYGDIDSKVDSGVVGSPESIQDRVRREFKQRVNWKEKFNYLERAVGIVYKICFIKSVLWDDYAVLTFKWLLERLTQFVDYFKNFI